LKIIAQRGEFSSAGFNGHHEADMHCFEAFSF